MLCEISVHMAGSVTGAPVTHPSSNWTRHCLKGRMILRCVKKAISHKCPYVIAIVVPYQIYTVVMMTICANQENNIV